MENEQDNQVTESTPEESVSRPWWQVWGARILVVALILLTIMYYINIAQGGR